MMINEPKKPNFEFEAPIFRVLCVRKKGRPPPLERSHVSKLLHPAAS